MSNGNILESLGFVLLAGLLIGTLFNFLKGYKTKFIPHNIVISTAGAAIGCTSSMLLPMVPEYHFVAVVTFTLLFSLEFMIIHWMVSRGTTPLAKCIDGYTSKFEADLLIPKSGTKKSVITKPLLANQKPVPMIQKLGTV